MPFETYSFTGNTQNSGEIKARDRDLIALSLDFGGGTATVDLERKIAGGGWQLLEQFTSDTEKNIEAVAKICSYRCSTSAYTSGTITMYMAAPD